MKKKYRIFNGLLVLLYVFMLGSCGASNSSRYIYTEEDKYVFVPDAMSSKFYPSGTETNVLLSELIFEGIVLNDGEVHQEEMEAGVYFVFNEYDVRVKDVWEGSSTGSKIRLRLIGDMQVLHENDRVVIYADYHEDTDLYIPVDNELSVFILNPPDDALFAVSSAAVCSAYDGNSADSLKEETAALVDKLAADLQKEADSVEACAQLLVGEVVVDRFSESIEKDVTK